MENWRLLLVLCCAVLAGGCRPREEQVRTIPVRVFADAEVRKSKDWQSLIRSRFKRVSRFYENAVQVRWKVSAVSDPEKGSRT